MKVLITKKQYNILLEDNRKTFFQEIIDTEVEKIKKACESPTSDSFPGHLSFEACDFIDIIDKIEVVGIDKDVEKYRGTNEKMFDLIVYVKINYTNIRDLSIFDFQNLMRDIKIWIQKSFGIKVAFTIEQIENSIKEKNW